MAAFEGASPNARLLTGQTPGPDANAQRFGGAFSVSLLTHVAGLLLILFVMSLPAPAPQPRPPFAMPTGIVWLDQKGPGGGGGGGGNGTTVTIAITGQGGRLAFSPNPATVAPGQLVVFKNNDSVAHHVMLDDGTLQTADIAPGATSAAVAMGTSGSSTYHCTIHPGMVGGFNGAEVQPPPNCNQSYCFGGS